MAAIETTSSLDPADIPVDAKKTDGAVLLDGSFDRDQILSRYYFLHFSGAIFPITMASLMYGWRALVLIGVVVASSIPGVMVWRRIGNRGAEIRVCQVIWWATLLAMMLPVHLMTTEPPFAQTPGKLWTLLCAAGLLIAFFSWLAGGGLSRCIGFRWHPVVAAFLVLNVLFGSVLVPHWVLRKDRLFVGDITRSEPAELAITASEGWMKTPSMSGYDGIYESPASEKLLHYTRALPRNNNTLQSLDGLLRDDMPPLEDMILGGHSGPIGTSSAVAVIIGGLFLLYRGIIDYRIPFLIYISATLSFIILPLPMEQLAPDGAMQIIWKWIAISDRDLFGSAACITFANYEVMAGPLLFMSFFLATSPLLRPVNKKCRFVYAVAIGILSAILQMRVSVSAGPYIALVTIGMLTFKRRAQHEPVLG